MGDTMFGSNTDYFKPQELPDGQAARAAMVRDRIPMRGNESYAFQKGRSIGFFETTYEMYMQETYVGDSLRYGIMPTDSALLNYEFNPATDFNPYKYYGDNLDTLQDMEEHIRGYLFDDVSNEDQFNERVERYRFYQKKKAELANGSIAGMLVGGIAGFADVTTLVPIVGWGKRLHSLGKVGKYAYAGLFTSAVQEAALQTRQELRTYEESLYNIGGGVVMGGGFGVFAKALDPNSALYYKGKANPMNPENPVRLGIGRIGTGMADNVVMRPVLRNGERVYERVSESPFGQSVGAAVRDTTELAKTGSLMAGGVAGVPIRAVGRGGLWATKKLGVQVSPIVRGLEAKSPKMREFTESMYNLGGILTEGMKVGKYNPAVEDLKMLYMSRLEHEVIPAAQQRYTQLRMKLAANIGKTYSPAFQTAASTGGRVKALAKDVAAGPTKTPRERGLNAEGVLDDWEFHDLTYKALYDDITLEELAILEKRFGKEGTEDIVKAANEQAEMIHDMNAMQMEDMKRLGMDVEDLGREYGVAQLWKAEGVRAMRDEAYGFFMKHFRGQPQDEFLEEYGLTSAQFDKLGLEDVTVVRNNGETETVTKAEGVAVKNEILDDWAHGQEGADIARLEQELEMAAEKARRTKRDAVLAARDMRKSWTEIKTASLKELKEILTKRVALRDRGVEELKLRKAEKAKLEAELKAALEETNVRANQYHDTLSGRSRIGKQRKAAVTEAEALLKMTDELGSEASKAEIEWARANQIKADNDLARTGEDALTEAVDKAAKLPVSSRRLATLRERIRTLDNVIKAKTDMLTKLDARLGRYEKIVNEATANKQNLMDLQKLQRKMLKDAQKEAGKAKRAERKLKRQVKKETARAPLHEYVEDLLDKLGNNEADAFGGFDSEFITVSGRTLRRNLRITKEERREAVRLGILRDDLYGILGKSQDDLSTRLALRDIFGNKSETDIVKDTVRAIKDDYDALIQRAKAQGKPRLVKKLEKERKKATSDVENGIKRQLGILGLAKSADSGWAFMGQLARAFNYVRYGSGFLIPSQADLSNVFFTSGFGTFTLKNGKAWARTMKGHTNHEIRMIALGSERILHSSTVMKMNQAEAGKETAGIGDYGSLTHYTTSTAERVVGGLAETTNVISGMAWWNTRMKALAMVQMQDTFVRHALKYDEILASASAGNLKSEKIIAEMASLGLGADQFRIIKKMMAKYPPELVEGIYELNMGRWLAEGKEGQQAFDSIQIGMNSTATRAIMTPGKGDTPFLMSDGFFKTLMQFQTYGFVSLNKYMVPAFQRMATYGDMEAFLSMCLASALGYGIVAATDIKRNGEVEERSASQWGYDIVDRAGFLMFLSTPISAASQQFGMTGASRYSMEKNRIALMLGPTGGLINDTWDLADAAVARDTDRMSQVGSKLMPFKLYKQIADVALEQYK